MIGNYIKYPQIPEVAAVEGVGKNLDDHVGVYLSYPTEKGSSYKFTDIMDPKIWKKYITKRSGKFEHISSITTSTCIQISKKTYTGN